MDRIGRRRAMAAGAGLATLALSGCQIDGDDDPRDRGPLSIAELALAEDQPSGYGEYEERPDGTFARGESLYLYAALDGLAARPLDGEVQIELTQRITLEHEEQGVVSDDETTHEQRVQPNVLDRFYVWNELPFEDGTTTGTYTLTAEFTDDVSETSDSASDTFTVVE